VKISEIMTRDVVAVSGETPLKEVARTLSERGISGVPVVDGAGSLAGVLAESDIVRTEQGVEREDERGLLVRLIEGPPVRVEARTAGDVMNAPAVTIGPDDEVAEAARLMTEQGFNRLPVVDGGGSLAGIVTRADLVRAFTRPDEEIEREIRDEVLLRTLWIDPASVQVSVHDGEVTLEGDVGQKADAELLEYFASRVPGVVAVRSDLSWRLEDPRPPASDPHVPAPPRTR
jgi:CBS domain-containing protein